MFPSKKFQIISDVHIETNKSINDIITPEPNATLIIAGDVGRVEQYKNYSDFIGYFCKLFHRVILVPGNHEYYTRDETLTRKKVDSLLFELKNIYHNLEILINSQCIIDNVLIFGSTFWSYCPHQYFSDVPIYEAENKLMDSAMYNRLHLSAQESLETWLCYARKQKLEVIVVTHYAPTFFSTLAEKYRIYDNKKNYMYCSHSDSYLENDLVKYWVYGHTGYSGNYNKLVSNQVGSEGFSKKKVIEI